MAPSTSSIGFIPSFFASSSILACTLLVDGALVLQVLDELHGTDGLEIDMAEPFGIRPMSLGTIGPAEANPADSKHNRSESNKSFHSHFLSLRIFGNRTVNQVIFESCRPGTLPAEPDEACNYSSPFRGA